jgi:hypothetical protein
MIEKQVELPDPYTLGDSWGIGWARFGWGGRRLIGHDGGTLGQAAFLRALPEEGLVVALFTNGGHAQDLYVDLYREIFAELAGLEMASPLAPPTEPVAVDVTPFLGRYERAGMRLDVLVDGGQPSLRAELTGSLAAVVPERVREYPMTAVDDGLFVVREQATETWIPVTFYELPTGQALVHFELRATPRIASQNPASRP